MLTNRILRRLMIAIVLLFSAAILASQRAAPASAAFHPHKIMTAASGAASL
jgi:hypothetical protein